MRMAALRLLSILVYSMHSYLAGFFTAPRLQPCLFSVQGGKGVVQLGVRNLSGLFRAPLATINDGTRRPT